MKQIQKIKKVSLLSGLLFVLSACAKAPVTQDSPDFWSRVVIYNLGQFIIKLGNLFGGNPAIGIILFTILIRIILIPLFKLQMDSQRKMQEIQPELEALKEKYDVRERSSMAVYEEQAQLMKERGVNQWASLLPILLQLPVMLALYQSIQFTPALSQGTFLWMNLSERDPYFIIPLLAAGFTYYSTYLNLLASPIKNTSSKLMTYVMPIMIFLVTVGLPSAVGIYLVVSNAFTVVQTLLLNNPYKIIEERQEEARIERERERRLKRQYRQITGKKK